MDAAHERTALFRALGAEAGLPLPEAGGTGTKSITTTSLGNFTTVFRQWKALTGFEDREVLNTDGARRKKGDALCLRKGASEVLKILNPSQNIALRAIPDGSGFTLVQGPPGTGKSTFMAVLAYITTATVLIVAESNQAVDSIARKYLCISNDITSILRIGARCGADLNDISLEYLQKAEKDRQGEKYDPQNFFNQLLRQRRVICATCSGAAALVNHGAPPHILVVDEAAQASELSTSVPFSLNATAIVLVGDPKQLPPTIGDPACTRKGLRSLFERLYESYPQHFLDTQFRMAPFLGNLVSSFFYNNTLKNGCTDEEITNLVRGTSLEPLAHFYHIEVQGEETVAGTSYLNQKEADRVVGFLHTLRTEDLHRVGVLSFYSGQVQLLREKTQHLEGFGLKVGSVDGFQGSEKDVVVISPVRTQRPGFLQDHRRVCVALSRARRTLVMIGSEDLHHRHVTIFKEIYSYLRTIKNEKDVLFQ